MKAKAIFIGIVVLAVAIGGLMWAAKQSADPQETAGDDAVVFEEITEPASSSGQLIQREPAMPDEAVIEGKELTGEEEQAGEEGAGGEEFLVSMTDLGFDPEEITIDKGTTVLFVNNGQAVHWPASDVHPTHEILPGFDAKRGLQTGEEYSYTFMEAGEWNYHDHLNAGLTGKVVVEE